MTHGSNQTGSLQAVTGERRIRASMDAMRQTEQNFNDGAEHIMAKYDTTKGEQRATKVQRLLSMRYS